MRLRLASLAIVGLAGLFPAAPTRAADLAKYVPEDAGLYVHVNVKQLLTAPVVRTAVPLAFQKYGDNILPLVQLAKAFNPDAAKISDDDVKKGIAELKKPETIAKAFDAVKEVVTDVVLAGDPDDEEAFLVLVKVPAEVNAQAVDAITRLIALNPQVKQQLKLKRHKKGEQIIYELEVPQQDQTFFAAVPEPGVLCFGGTKEMVETAVDRAGKEGGLNDKLKPLVAKRTPKDFLFVAVAGGADEDGIKAGHGSLVLDKDIAGRLSVTYTSPAKAREAAKEMNETLSSFADTLKDFLGDQAKQVQPILDKMKATADGATVTGQFTVPGAVIEKLLAKEKDE